MQEVNARSTKAEILEAAGDFANATGETIAELQRQRLALLGIIAILATMLSF